jgi:hypothetical protein
MAKAYKFGKGRQSMKALSRMASNMEKVSTTRWASMNTKVNLSEANLEVKALSR